MSENNLHTLNHKQEQKEGFPQTGQQSLPKGLDKIIAASPDLYLILSPDFTIQMVTDAYLRATSCTREEITGKYLFEVFPENRPDPEGDTIKNLRASLHQVISTKEPQCMGVQRYDLPPCKEAGSELIQKYWLPLNTPVLDESGEILYIIHKVEEVTEAVEARRRMEENESLLKSTEDIAHTGSYQSDLSTMTFRFSDGMYRLFGEEPGAFVPSLDFINSRSHPDDIAPIAAILNGAAIDKKPYYYTRRIYTKSGDLRTLEAHGKVVCDEAGNARMLRGLVQDITERKLAEEELKRSEKRSRDLLNVLQKSPDAYLVLSPEFTILLVSDAYLEATFLKRQAIVGRHMFDVFPDNPSTPDVTGVKNLRASFKKVLASKKPHRMTIQHYDVRRADGSFEEKYWSPVNTPVLNEAGNVEYIIHHVVDVTEVLKKQAELKGLASQTELLKTTLEEVKLQSRKLNERKETIEQMLNGSLSAITILQAIRNEQGKIADFEFKGGNKAAEALNQLSIEESIGRGLLELFPGVKDVFFDDYVQVVETGEPMRVQRYYSHEHFDHWFDVSAVKNGDGFIMTYHDITAQKKAEEEIKKNIALLHQSEEMAGMGSWEYNLLTEEFKWSDGMYRLFGLPNGSKVSPHTYLDFVIEQDRHLAANIIGNISINPASFEETLRIKVDATVQTLKVKGMVIKDAAGNPSKMLGLDLNITQVKRLEEENLELRLRQQKDLLLAILEAQEEERRRISESLHNGVGQILYAAQLSLQGMNLNNTPLLAQDLQSYKEKTESLLKEAIRDLRSASHELVPVLLEQFGLEEAIKDFCNRFSQTGINFTCHGFEGRLEKHLQLAVYRITQELVNNIARHSAASRARLEMFREKDSLVMEAQDNGKGLAAASTSGKGIGLKTIADRVKLLGGTMEIESTLGKGTLITIILPAIF